MEVTQSEEESAEASCHLFADIDDELPEKEPQEDNKGADLHQDMAPALPWKAATLLQASSSDDLGRDSHGQVALLSVPENLNSVAYENAIVAQELGAPALQDDADDHVAPHVGVPASSVGALDNDIQEVDVAASLEDAVANDVRDVGGTTHLKDAVDNDGQDISTPAPLEDAVHYDGQDVDGPAPPKDDVVHVDQDVSTLAPLEDTAHYDGQDVGVPAFLKDAVDNDVEDVSTPAPLDDAVHYDDQDVGVPAPLEDAVDRDGQDVSLHEPLEDAVYSDVQVMASLPPHSEDVVAAQEARPDRFPDFSRDTHEALATSMTLADIAQDVFNKEGASMPLVAPFPVTVSAPSSDFAFKCDDLETASASLPDDAMDTDQVKAPTAMDDSPPPAGPASAAISQDSKVGLMQGLQALQALPSEAALIQALRRHCCWVCGASAPSHDANISHMLTHLQGAAPAPAAAPVAAPVAAASLISPVSSDNSLTDAVPMPTLGASPSNVIDSKDNEDRQNGLMLDRKGSGVSLSSDSPGWSSPASPVARAEPAESESESVPEPLGAVPPCEDDDAGALALPSEARDASPGRPVSPCSPPPDPDDATSASEVTYFKGPPRFSYAARTARRALAALGPRYPVATTAPRPRRAPLSTSLRACPQPVGAVGAAALLPAEDPKVAPLSVALTGSPSEAEAARGEDAVGAAQVCAICLKTFPSRAVLLEHVAGEVRALSLQARRGRKPKAPQPPPPPVGERFACAQCPASYSRSQQLRCHVKASHSHAVNGVDRPHACRVCPMRFRRLSHLQQHTLVHTGEKPFCCDLCGENFRRKDRLVLHVRQHTLEHTIEKPFRCHLCGENFRRKDRLVLHVRQHKQRKAKPVPIMSKTGKALSNTKPLSTVLAVSEGSRVVPARRLQAVAEAKVVLPARKLQAVAEVKKVLPARKLQAVAEAKPVLPVSKTQQKQSVLKPRPGAVSKSPIKAVRAVPLRVPGGGASEPPADAVLTKPGARGASESEPPPAPPLVKRGRGRPKKIAAGAVLLAKVAELSKARLHQSEAVPAAATAPAAAPRETKAKVIKVEAEALRCLTCYKVFPAKGKLRQHVLHVHAATMRHVCLTCGQGNPSREQLHAHVAAHIQERVRQRAVKKAQPAAAPAATATTVTRALQVKVEPTDGAEPAKNDDPMEVDESASQAEADGPPDQGAPASSASTPSKSVAAPGPGLASAGPTAAPAPAAAVKPKAQPRLLIRVVSKHGVRDAASVAAKFLPQLALDLESKGGLRNMALDSKNRKVMYMMMSKRSSNGTSEAADPTGDAGAPANLGGKRKVILKVVPKKRPAPEHSENTQEQPKPGFRVVSRIVPLTGSNNDSKKATKVVAVNAFKPVAGVTALAHPGASAMSVTASESDPKLDSDAAVLKSRSAPASLASPACPQAPNPRIEGTTMAARAESAERPATRTTPGMRLKSSPSVTTPRATPYTTPKRNGTSPASPWTSSPATRTSVRSSPRTPLGASPQTNVDSKTLVISTADNRFLCEKCGGRFLGETAYLLHIRSHGMTPMKTYQCHCCYMKFFDKEVLKAHMHTHL